MGPIFYNPKCRTNGVLTTHPSARASNNLESGSLQVTKVAIRVDELDPVNAFSSCPNRPHFGRAGSAFQFASEFWLHFPPIPF